jgi:hypothetical protein
LAASFVTKAELRTNLGIGSLYNDAIVEEVCQAAQDIIDGFLLYNSAPVTGSSLTNNVATLALASPAKYVIGQEITVSGCGTIYNGTHTITGTIPSQDVTTLFRFTYPTGRNVSFVQFAKSNSDIVFTPIIPFGKVVAADTKTQTYAATPAVREAAMMLAVDIWQARQVSQTGGVSVDGFSPNPYRMGYHLLGKIKGLLAPYLATESMVG